MIPVRISKTQVTASKTAPLFFLFNTILRPHQYRDDYIWKRAASARFRLPPVQAQAHQARVIIFLPVRDPEAGLPVQVGKGRFRQPGNNGLFRYLPVPDSLPLVNQAAGAEKKTGPPRRPFPANRQSETPRIAAQERKLHPKIRAEVGGVQGLFQPAGEEADRPFLIPPGIAAPGKSGGILEHV